MREPDFWIIRPTGSTIATAAKKPVPIRRIIKNPPHWGVDDTDITTFHFWNPSWEIFKIEQMEFDWWYPVWVEVNP